MDTQKSLDIEIEEAIRMLASYMPVSTADSKKSPFFHDVRVGTYLYNKEYPRDIILAGFLHDALEHSETPKEEIKKEFGENVLALVKANSKDYSIDDSWQRVEEMTSRAGQAGKDALIIRAADTINSFKHYTQTQNENQLSYCRKNAEEIFKYKTDEINDPVFEELREWNKQN